MFDNGAARSVLTRRGTESVLYLYVVFQRQFYFFRRKLTFVSLEFALKTVFRRGRRHRATHSQGGCHCFSPVAVSFSLRRWADVYKNPLKDVRRLYVCHLNHLRTSHARSTWSAEAVASSRLVLLYGGRGPRLQVVTHITSDNIQLFYRLDQLAPNLNQSTLIRLFFF